MYPAESDIETYLVKEETYLVKSKLFETYRHGMMP